jgi:hypothetical protein
VLGGNAEGGDVLAAEAAEQGGRDAPGHGVVGEVAERVAEGGELPVEQGDGLGAGRDGA